VCCAAALASLRKILSGDLTGNAASLGPVLEAGLAKIQRKHPSIVGHSTCRGLVAGLQMVRAAGRQPDHELAHKVIEKAFHKGLLLFSPVGAWGQTIKIAPPLTITREALTDGLSVLSEAVAEAEMEEFTAETQRPRDKAKETRISLL
jgi:4-aminobutyrate aminotransferase / (S)-3-amino-2-methylpropionate transaminase / 5-aminovalerate transaminase